MTLTNDILADLMVPEITPDMHQAAIAAAIERAKQETFEECVKETCIFCRGEYPFTSIVPTMSETTYTLKHGANNCRAHILRTSFPARAAVMDAKRQSVTRAQ